MREVRLWGGEGGWGGVGWGGVGWGDDPYGRSGVEEASPRKSMWIYFEAPWAEKPGDGL